MPTLGEARGKIVLIRRFYIADELKKEWDSTGWGINAETWPDNTPFGPSPGGDISVQDFYEVLDTANIDTKLTYCTAHLERAARAVCLLSGLDAKGAGPQSVQPLYLNFLSASNFWNVGCWPSRIAAKINPAVVDYLCRRHGEALEGDWGTGVIVCDWVGNNGDWDLVRAIVGMNAKLEMREKSLMSCG
jgi:1-phosphatidylinositol phosphodiesterase